MVRRKDREPAGTPRRHGPIRIMTAAGAGGLIGAAIAPAIVIMVSGLASTGQDLGFLAWLYGAAAVGFVLGAAAGAATTLLPTTPGTKSRTWAFAGASAVAAFAWVAIMLGF